MVTFLEGSSAVTLPKPVIDCIISLKIYANIVVSIETQEVSFVNI